MLLAAALAVRGTRFGHVCIKLASQREAVFVDGLEGVATDELPWPSAVAWEAAVATSPLVGDGEGDTPLVLVDDRLYLQRYHAYEDLVAGFITDRIGSKTKELDTNLSSLLDVALPAGDAPDRPGSASRQGSPSPNASPSSPEDPGPARPTRSPPCCWPSPKATSRSRSSPSPHRQARRPPGSARR